MNLVAYDDDDDSESQEEEQEREQEEPEKLVEQQDEEDKTAAAAANNPPSQEIINNPPPWVQQAQEDASIIIPDAESVRERIRQLTMPETLAQLPPNVDYDNNNNNNQQEDKLNAKLTEFARLKSSSINPQDFNLKLCKSKAFTNPNISNKLREFMNINNQYGSTFGIDIWDPSKLPQRGYAHEIISCQRKLQQSQRSRIDFAPSNK